MSIYLFFYQNNGDSSAIVFNTLGWSRTEVIQVPNDAQVEMKKRPASTQVNASGETFGISNIKHSSRKRLVCILHVFIIDMNKGNIMTFHHDLCLSCCHRSKYWLFYPETHGCCPS